MIHCCKTIPEGQLELRFTPEARPLVSGIAAGLPSRSPFSVSNAGVLAYWTHPLGAPSTLRWFGRDGRGSDAIAKTDAPLGRQ